MKMLFLAAIAAAVVAIIVWIMRSAGSGDAGNTRRGGPRGGGVGPKAGGVPTGATAERVNWLIAISGAIRGKTFHVGERIFTIGRGANNHIQVLDNQTSRVHCQIVPKGGSLEFHDMESQNGTFLNDKRTSRGILREGDQLRIGTVTLIYKRHYSADHDDAMAWKVVTGRAGDATVAVGQNSITSLIDDAMRDCGNDRDAAATLLGMPRTAIDRILDGPSASAKGASGEKNQT